MTILFISIIVILVITIIALFRLGQSQKTATIVPHSNTTQIDDAYTIIWYGKSEAYYYQNDTYVRAPVYDYVFNVIQKRYDHTWKSIKTLHRNHEEYDGKA